MIADLDTLLIALYVELTDQIIPSLGLARSPAGISRSGCASRSTARQTAAIQTAPNRHPARHPPMAPRHPCQPKTVCVPFMITAGDSYRMREARAKGGTTLNKT